MRPRFAMFLAVVLMGLGSLAVQAQPRGRGGWLSSLSEGKTEARKSGKPLMVVIRCEP